MVTLWWVRHAPTHQKTFTGWRDVPADVSDAAAFARLSLFLPREACIVSSDLERCIATADLLQTDRRLRLPHHSGLREFDFGDWDGRHFDDVAKSDPELSRAYWEQPGDVAPPSGESWNNAASRVSAAIDEICQADPAAHLVVVSHFGAILTQLQRATGQSAENTLAQRIDNLSVTELRHDKSGWQVGVVNHIA